jgi:two-component system, LytTR family, sensor kinase
MKIRWRQQEMLFAIAVSLILLVKLILREVTPGGFGHSRINIFTDAGIPYSFFLNSLLPFLLRYFVPLALLLLVNAWLFPRYATHRHRWWIFAAALLGCWILLCTAFGMTFYLEYYNFSISAGEAAHRADGRRFGLSSGTAMVLLYLLYLVFRELIISWLEKEGPKQSFGIMLCNRITLTGFLYSFMIILVITFKLITSDGGGIALTFILLPVIVSCFINIYVLYPRQYSRKISFIKNLPRLALTPFLLSFIAWIFYVLSTGNFLPMMVPFLFTIIMILATPLSWLIYIQQKEKIDALLVLEKQLGKTTADLAFLRSQINPHFLFNTLNTLYGTALQEQATRTASGIQRLGDMMRFLLHDNNRESIPLSREIEYLKHYITLQSLRIAESTGVRIETSISEANCNYNIAPMLLIPFVENAFKHGIRLTRPSYILFKLYCDEKGLHVDLVNSLHPKQSASDEEEGYSGVGMENVRQRLELLYPQAHQLTVHQDDAAFQVRLFIRLSGV